MGVVGNEPVVPMVHPVELKESVRSRSLVRPRPRKAAVSATPRAVAWGEGPSGGKNKLGNPPPADRVGQGVRAKRPVRRQILQKITISWNSHREGAGTRQIWCYSRAWENFHRDRND